MPNLEIYDPAMCCATGVCGVQVDPTLAQFTAALAWLERRGVNVSRYNLAMQPHKFVENAAVSAALQQDAEVLPLILLDGIIISRRVYPTRAELAQMAGLEAPPERLALPVLNG